MSDLPVRRHLRQDVDSLTGRLASIERAAAELRAMAPSVRHGVPQDALVALMDRLERDLWLAAASAQELRDHAAWDADRRVDDVSA
jgi:hypothetical protein